MDTDVVNLGEVYDGGDKSEGVNDDGDDDNNDDDDDNMVAKLERMKDKYIKQGQCKNCFSSKCILARFV